MINNMFESCPSKHVPKSNIMVKILIVIIWDLVRNAQSQSTFYQDYQKIH